MDLGYITTKGIEVSAIVNREKKVFELGLINTPDGFEILQRCPLSFGQFSENEMNELGKEAEIELRKKEHLIIVNMIKKYSPEDFHKILDRVPYFDTLELLQKMMSGEDEISEETVIEDYGKDSPQYKLWLLMNNRFGEVVDNEIETKKKANTGLKKKSK